MKRIDVPLTSRRIGGWLALAIIVLVAANLLSLWVSIDLAYGDVFGWPSLFILNNERNIPTLFSSLIFIINGGLAIAIPYFVKAQYRYRRVWYFVGATFIFLGIDEFVMIHENLSAPLRNLLGTGEKLYFAWVLPYALLVIVVGVISVRMFFSLPRIIQVMLVTSGVLYLTGAIGIELVSQSFFKLQVQNSEFEMGYLLITTIEETFEMAGLGMCMVALFHYISTSAEKLVFTFQLTQPTPQPQPQPARRLRPTYGRSGK